MHKLGVTDPVQCCLYENMLILLKFHKKVCSDKVRNENVNFTQLYIKDKVGTNKDHPDYHAHRQEEGDPHAGEQPVQATNWA